MKYVLRIMILTAMSVWIVSIAGFSQYYDLDGKWVELHGPANFGLLGVAKDEAACERLIAAENYGDGILFAQVLKDYDFFRVRNRASALVLEVKLFENKAKVMVFDGWYKRESGWVPLQWLSGNSRRPLMKDFVKNSVLHYPLNPPFQFYKQNLLY